MNSSNVDIENSPCRARSQYQLGLIHNQPPLVIILYVLFHSENSNAVNWVNLIFSQEKMFLVWIFS